MGLELLKTPLAGDANIKALYRMESGALTTDSSGKGKTLTNNNTVGEGAGVFGGASDQGASNSNKYFHILDNLGINNKIGSISFWVKLKTEISSGSYCLVETQDDTQNFGIRVLYEYNAGTRRLSFRTTQANQNNVINLYNITLGTSNWYHIVITVDATNQRAYVNGALVGGPTTKNISGLDCTNVTTIGASLESYPTLTSVASAMFDDVAFFDRALTDAEVLSIYQGDGWQVTTNYLTNYRPRRRTPGAVSV